MTAKTIDDLVDLFGVTPANVAQAKLPLELRRLHQQILTAVVETGAPPTLDWVRERARELGLDDERALATLAAADLVHTGDGAVTITYPFAALPTPDRVQLAGGPVVWACCAVDALGIPLMTGRDAAIDSSDQHTGKPIRIRFSGGIWTWEPAGTVVLVAGTTDGCSAAEAVCPHIRFFTSAENAQAHLDANPGLQGVIVDQATAIEGARAIFGPLLRS